MSNFIPLTGSTNIVDQIIERFQGVPNFDFIEYTDAQKVTGQLFYELIGDAFVNYKDLETFAQIESDPTAIGLVNGSSNAQKVIEGIAPTTTGFALDAPDIKTYSGNDGFILLAITNQIATPEASILQYRVNGGGWITLATLTDEITTSYVVLPELPNNETFVIEARQSLFGTPSLIAGKSVVTTPTAANWNAFFKDTATRDHFYTDSYTNNNTYGTLTSKTVMEMIFESPAVVSAIAENDETLSIMEVNQDNIDLLISSATGIEGLVNVVNGVEHIFNDASQTNKEAYLGAIAASESAMLNVANNSFAFEAFIADTEAITAIDNVDQATRILILEQTATQDYTNFTNVADFIDDQTAMAEVAASQNAMRALIASANAVAEKVLEPIALNEVFSRELATLIVASNLNAIDQIIDSSIAIEVLENYDLAQRILILVPLNENYTLFNTAQEAVDEQTVLNLINSNLQILSLSILLNLIDLSNYDNLIDLVSLSSEFFESTLEATNDSDFNLNIKYGLTTSVDNSVQVDSLQTSDSFTLSGLLDGVDNDIYYQGFLIYNSKLINFTNIKTISVTTPATKSLYIVENVSGSDYVIKEISQGGILKNVSESFVISDPVNYSSLMSIDDNGDVYYFAKGNNRLLHFDKNLNTLRNQANLSIQGSASGLSVSSNNLIIISTTGFNGFFTVDKNNLSIVNSVSMSGWTMDVQYHRFGFNHFAIPVRSTRKITLFNLSATPFADADSGTSSRAEQVHYLGPDGTFLVATSGNSSGRDVRVYPILSSSIKSAIFSQDIPVLNGDSTQCRFITGDANNFFASTKNTIQRYTINSGQVNVLNQWFVNNDISYMHIKTSPDVDNRIFAMVSENNEFKINAYNFDGSFINTIYTSSNSLFQLNTR